MAEPTALDRIVDLTEADRDAVRSLPMAVYPPAPATDWPGRQIEWAAADWCVRVRAEDRAVASYVGISQSAPLLAVTGTIAWLVGCLAAAFTLRAGISWIPAVLLAISGVSFLVWRTHASPGGPIAFGALAAAAAWLRWASPERAGARQTLPSSARLS